jgi:hypothetical protein
MKRIIQDSDNRCKLDDNKNRLCRSYDKWKRLNKISTDNKQFKVKWLWFREKNDKLLFITNKTVHFSRERSFRYEDLAKY